MTHKKFIPPTLQEAEDYVRVKNLLVDPEFFINYFTAGEWIDSKGNPVKSWKQKMWTWHRAEMIHPKYHTCTYSCCRKPGVYIIGRDSTGSPVYRCINHKPKPKPLHPQVAALADKALKPVPKEESMAVKANIQVRRLLGKEQ